MRALLTFLVFVLISKLAYSQDQLMVGLSAVDVEPAIGIPLAGYGSTSRRLPGFVDWRNRHPEAALFRPSEGIHSPIRSKVMVLKKDGRFLVFLSLDTVGVEHKFVRDMAYRLYHHGIMEKDIFASATHTHGGPGTISRRLPLQLVAVDFFKRKNYNHVLEKAVRSVEEAINNLEPAELFKTSVQVEGVQKNKWRKKDEEHYDKKASFLLAKSRENGQWLGGLVNFAIHGGTMPIPILHYSSDINGAIEKELEKYFDERNVYSSKEPVFLFMNGAEGDVGPAGARGVERIDELAGLFIEQAKPALSEEKLTKVSPEFFITKRRIFLGIPALSLSCNIGLFKKLPPSVRISIWPLLPARTSVTLAKVGDITMMSWPGEPSTQLGYDLKQMARRKGATDPWVIGLANDYAAYFTTKSEFYEKAYDSCSSIYGYRGGRRIINAHALLLDWYL